MVPLGSITASLKLDKVHSYTENIPVVGSVSVSYKPNSGQQDELFGPLRLRLTLQGHIKLHVAENRTSHAYIFFDENHVFFRKTQDIFDGPLRTARGQPVTFPFQLRFPDTAEIAYSPSSIKKQRKLPPSFKTRFEAQAPRQYGKHQGRAGITYRLRVAAEMPGIDVGIVKIEDTEVQYHSANDSSYDGTKCGTQGISQMLEVRSYDFLPEDERPSSLMSRAKAVLNSVSKPTFAFTATCARIPRTISVGKALRFEVRVKLEPERTTTPITPSIALTDGRLGIIARTELHATNKKGVDSPRLEDTAFVSSLSMKSRAPTESFAKRDDYTKEIEFEKLTTEVPSAFVTEKLKRSYHGRLELHFLIAGAQSVVMRKDSGAADRSGFTRSTVSTSLQS